MKKSNLYTNEEIVRLYRTAKNKPKEIMILVELTCSDVDTILRILADAGEFDGNYKVCTKCGTKYPVPEDNHIKTFCPCCRKKEQRIEELRYKVKERTSKIHQLSLESARLRAEIERLENEIH